MIRAVPPSTAVTLKLSGLEVVSTLAIRGADARQRLQGIGYPGEPGPLT
jgi:hypothetical protein